MKQIIKIAFIIAFAVMALPVTASGDEYECYTTGTYGQNEVCEKKKPDKKIVEKTSDGRDLAHSERLGSGFLSTLGRKYQLCISVPSSTLIRAYK